MSSAKPQPASAGDDSRVHVDPVRRARARRPDAAALLEASPDAHLAVDRRGRLTAANAAALALLGGGPELFGRKLHDLLPQVVGTVFDTELRRVLTLGVTAEFEAPLPPSGPWLQIRACPYPGGLAVCAQNILARRRLEGELDRALALAATGLLASGVAHEFGDLLTAVVGYAGLLRDALNQADPARELTVKIKKAVERGAVLTRRLVALDHADDLVPAALDLNALVTDAAKMLRQMVGEDIRLVTELRLGLRPVRADPLWVSQVLLTLAGMAYGAMPGGGTVTLATRELTPGATHLGPGAFALLEVTATGNGLAEAVRVLAGVRGRVEKAGGRIEIESTSGQNTTVRVYLPRA